MDRMLHNATCILTMRAHSQPMNEFGTLGKRFVLARSESTTGHKDVQERQSSSTSDLFDAFWLQAAAVKWYSLQENSFDSMLYA